MTQQALAVYEHGTLKLLGPVSLAEQQKVRVKITVMGGENWMDEEFMDSCAVDSDPAIRLEDVRAALAKIGESMDSAIDETRGEW